MAAPTYISAGTGATDAGGAWSYTCQAPGAAGRLIIVQILMDGPTYSDFAVTGSSNINDLAGSAGWSFFYRHPVGGAGGGNQFFYIGRSTSTSAPTISGTNAGSEDLYIRSYEFDNVSTGTTLASVVENMSGSTNLTYRDTNGTDGTVQDAQVTTNGPDRLALNFVAINDDNAVAAFTGMTGGSWREVVAEYAEASGTDGTIQLQLSPVADAVYGGPYTQAVDMGRYSTAERLAQSFTATGNLYAVGYGLGKLGSPTDNVLVSIQTDASDAPSGTIVGTQISIAGAGLGSIDWAWREGIVNASLTPTAKYWIVFERSGALDSDNYFRVVHPNADVLASHEAKQYNGSSWSAISSGTDLSFSLIGAAGGDTIDGGTTANSDATDSWGVVGFALIGTTVASKSIIARHRYHLIRR